MELLNVALTSIGSIIVLFILTKLIGNRALSELNMFDYINGITIGSIAAEMATSLEDDFMKPLLAMVIYSAIVLLFSFLSGRSTFLRRIFTGRSLVLFNNGKLYKKNFAKAKIDMTEFLSQCRLNGFFDLSELQMANFEPNGKIAFMPKADYRPATPKDFSLKTDMEKPSVPVVTDGQVLDGNLRYTGNDRQWLLKELKELGLNGPEDVFLAEVDYKNKLSAYVKLEEKPDRDIFQ